MKYILKHKLLRAFSKIKGYTLVEVVVAVSIIAILASLVILNLTEARKSARDSRRKSDIQTYVSAFNSYRVTNPNFFIEDKKAGTCSNGVEVAQLDDSSCVDANGNACTVDSAFNSGAACVGALGRSFGKINLASVSSESPVKDGYKAEENSAWARPYATTSIAQALFNQGFLNNLSKDPMTKSGLVNNDPTLPDYTLIRSCANGKQALNKGGVLFTVFGILERTPSAVDTSSMKEYAGLNPNVKATDASSVQYRPDFANRDFYIGNNQKRFYGVGNSPVENSQQSINWSTSLDCSNN